jgi:addiction module HigA family antidote
MAKKLPPVHPGEILREEFLVPLKLTSYVVAAALHVPRTRIERIAREEKPVTADTALRLGKFFKTGAAFWMNIQARFDLETAEDALAPQMSRNSVRNSKASHVGGLHAVRNFIPK